MSARRSERPQKCRRRLRILEFLDNCSWDRLVIVLGLICSSCEWIRTSGEKFDELLIPKFKISCTFEPSDVMKELGLTLPFDVNNKELNGIVEQKYPYDKKLYVSKILQKSFIKVDEKGTETAGVSVLKMTKGGLKDLLQVFHSDHSFFYGDFNLVKQKFDELLIPKFKISCTFEPSDVMKELGLTLPFDVNNKELNGIVEQKYPYDKKLYVSKILQKSFIKVDEKGTETAGVSVLKMTKGGKLSPPGGRFVADHPFMFLIRRENKSRAIFFSGVVVT
uniref:Serpin-ZX n=1 Tax=Tanacetum cinerariifolium TaxID=118510 RepID=A0A6L2K5P2_TANCI|nr:serpin-ZX [Tanacetum cinerariifolium]